MLVPILTTHYFLTYIFRLKTLKGPAKASPVDPYRLSTPRGNKTAFLPLKGTTSTAVVLCGSLPSPGSSIYLKSDSWQLSLNFSAWQSASSHTILIFYSSNKVLWIALSSQSRDLNRCNKKQLNHRTQELAVKRERKLNSCQFSFYLS